MESLARVLKAELAEEDKAAYALAAVRGGASRHAAEPVGEPPRAGPVLQVVQGEPGQTCLRLVDAEHPETRLSERCTYGWVWPGSLRRSAQGTAVTVAVQLLDSWTELWVFHREGETWAVDALAPAATEPVLGYVELAGFSPDGSRVLVAREALVEGRVKSTFQVLKRETLVAEKSAERPQDSGTFHRWSSAEWRGRTVAVR